MQLIVGQDPHRFEIATVTDHAPTVSMVARGDIDLATAPLLLSALRGAIDTHAPQVLELDLSGLAFLDARGIAALLQAGLAARTIGCHVRLIGPPGHLRRLLELTRVDCVWELVD